MERGLTINEYLSLNRGKYVRKAAFMPHSHSNVYVTIHHDLAATDRLHFHDKAHLSYILRGGVMDRRLSSEAERFTGDVLFFRSGEAHETIYHGFPVKNINIEFDHDFFRELGVGEDKIATSAINSAATKFTMLRIFREFVFNDEFSPASVELLIGGLFADDVTHSRRRPQWLNTVVEYLADNWNAGVSVDDLACVSGVHPKTISKQFTRFVGCTLGEYRRRLRVEHSLELIRNSKRSLTDIALECGFYDQSHFISVFKHITGFRPREYKNM